MIEERIVMNIQAQDIVSIHFKMKDEAGVLLETTEGDAPLTYTHSSGVLMEGMEKALEGRVEGEHFSAVVSPEEGFGEWQADKVFRATYAELGNQQVEIGDELCLEDEAGHEYFVNVTAIEPDSVIMDANHPWAGKTLFIEGQVISVERN
jgi:FKBP-type peptidyl-prolyl cis-trans isomerase SlyD